MEDEDSIAALLDFEVWFVPRSGGGGESAHAHAPSTSQQEASGLENRDQQPQQSTGGAQPSGNEEAPPSGRQARGKQRGGRARGGRRGSAGRQPVSKKGDDAADAEEGKGPAKRARTEETTPEAQGPTTPGTVVVRTSRLALCARSKVLRPILTSCKQTKLDVPYDSQEQLEAGKTVVQVLQDLTMPPELQKLKCNELAASLLVQMCHWAVYWDAPAVVELCLDCLSSCDLNVLSASDISGTLELPSAIHTMSQYAKAKERCAAWLLHSYSDVPKIIADDGLRASFCSKLSFAAVALWAAQDDLAVRSENEVAVLLSYWYEARDCVSEDEEAELSGLVRVCQMQKSFRLFVLPKLPWFCARALFSGGFSFAYEDGGAAAASSLYGGKLPDAWVASARRGRPVLGSKLTLAFTKLTLASMLARVAAKGMNAFSDSSCQPFCGYYVCLECSLRCDGSLGIFVKIKGSEDDVIPAPEAIHVSYCLSHIQANGGATWIVRSSGTWLDVGGEIVKGSRNAFRGTAFKSLEDFAPFLVDEKLVFQCEVSNLK